MAEKKIYPLGPKPSGEKERMLLMDKAVKKLAAEFSLRLSHAQKLVDLYDGGNSIDDIAALVRGISDEELRLFYSRLEYYRSAALRGRKTLRSAILVFGLVLALLLALPGLPYLAGAACLGMNSYESAIGCYRASDRLSLFGSFFNAAYMAEEGVYVRMAEDAVAKRDRIRAAEAFMLAGREYQAKEQYYLAGRELLDAGDFEAASAVFDKAGDYRDAGNRIPLAYLEQGRELVKEKQYAEAYELFLSMKEDYIEYFGSSGEYNGLRELIYESAYYYGIECEEAGELDKAIELYSAAGTFADAQSREYALRYNHSQTLIAGEQYAAAAETLKPIRSYENNLALWQDCAYKAAALAMAEGDYAFAAERYLELGEYLDSEEQASVAMYAYVQEHAVSDDEKTYEYLCILRKQKYLDSAELYRSLYKWEISIDAISRDVNDRESMITKFALDEPVVFHFTLLGGDRANEKLTYTYTYQNGYTQSGSLSLAVGEQKYLYHDNSTNLCHDIPGEFTVDFYDSKGNHIGHILIEYLE